MIIKDYLECVRCKKLCETRKKIVWGSGPKRAPILFVGEAPGVQEELQGKPFVGPSGEQHWHMLKSAEIPKEWVYNTNAVLCRPASYNNPMENRAPTTEEVKNCRPRLFAEIVMVDPLIVVALGKTAMYALTGKAASIKNVMGDIKDVEIVSPYGAARYPVMALLHPSYIMQNATDIEVQMQFDHIKFLKKIVDFMLKE